MDYTGLRHSINDFTSSDIQSLEEEREALLQSVLWVSKALAVENRAPEPEKLEDALRPPTSVFWAADLGLVRDFVADSSLPQAQVADTLQRLLT